MSSEAIKGESPFTEHSWDARLFAAVFLWFLLVMPTLLWFAYPEWPVRVRVACVCFMVAVAFYFIFKNWDLFVGGILRFLGGEAEIEVRPEGFFLKRRFGTTHYAWSDVRRVELVCYCHVDIDVSDFNVVIHFPDGCDIWVKSDQDWGVLDRLRGWSGGRLDRVEVVAGGYDGDGEFVELKESNEGYA